jgi:hypothetical protein
VKRDDVVSSDPFDDGELNVPRDVN